MDTTTLGRTGALLVSAALLASLTVATVATPVTAQVPTCDGRPATITDNDGIDADPTVGRIVGTPGNDVIVGTEGDDFIYGDDGNDRICGGLGVDYIFGEAQRDRLFGGSGGDVIAGGPGGDDIFGFAGNDTIVGQGGNDFIHGGAGFDDCSQGPGSGPIKQCEKADLRVKVTGPGHLNGNVVVYKVRVTNAGPHASAYRLVLGQAEHGVDFCDGQEKWVGEHLFPKLGPGKSRVRSYGMYCEDNTDASWVLLRARAAGYARDTKQRNNHDSKKTFLD